MHKFIFGVFRDGHLVLEIGRTECTMAQAAVIVGVLDMAKDCLQPGDYFACDF